MTGSQRARGYPRVVVVVSGWPRISETFAVNELQAMNRAGVLAGIVATKPGDSSLRQPGTDALEPLVTVLADGDAVAQAAQTVRLVEGLNLAGGRVAGLHGYFAHRPAEVAALAAARLGLPYGFSTHALDVRKVEASVLTRRAGGAAVVVTCNAETARTLADLGIEARLVPHGVDTERFRPTPRATAHDHVELLAVGRLVEKKGFVHLIRAMAMLDDTFRLRIVGDGPDRTLLTDLAAELGVDGRIRFIGRCNHDDLPALYASADMVVVPSVVDRAGDRDGLPNVVLEAMASGRTVVASDVAAIATAIHTVDGPPNGSLVPAGDPAALAAEIRRLGCDAAVRDAIGAAARHTVAGRFELGRCSEHFCELMVDTYG